MLLNIERHTMWNIILSSHDSWSYLRDRFNVAKNLIKKTLNVKCALVIPKDFRFGHDCINEKMKYFFTYLAMFSILDFFTIFYLSQILSSAIPYGCFFCFLRQQNWLNIFNTRHFNEKECSSSIRLTVQTIIFIE